MPARGLGAGSVIWLSRAPSEPPACCRKGDPSAGAVLGSGALFFSSTVNDN